MKHIDSELGKFKEDLYLIQQDVKQAFYERAINKIHELMVHHPDKAEPYYEMGRISYNFWRNDEAELNYRKALEIDPEYFPTYTQYALILIKEGRSDEAEELLLHSFKLRNRDDADTYFYLGLLYQQKKELDKAIEAFEKAVLFSINETQIDLNMKFIRACKEIRGSE